MGTYTKLKEAIKDVIRPNAAEEITGSIMQTALLNIVSTMGKYSQFGGIATPSTSPSMIDQNVFYIATQKGTYPYFSNIYVDGASIIYYDTIWRVHSLGLTESGNGGSGEGGDPDDGTNPDETLVITGPDSLTEGESYDYKASDPRVDWSIESGAMGSDKINIASGLLVTDGDVGQTRTLVIKAAYGTSVGRKVVKVYAKDSGNGEETLYPEGGTITGDAPLLQETTYHLNLQPAGVNVDYTVEWLVEYSEGVEIVNSDNESCTVRPINNDYEQFLLVATIIGSGFRVWASQWIQKGESPVYDNTDTIIIDQREVDVTIGGEINNAQIQVIRGGSHRYLGKFYLGKMHICQLKDDDGTKYWDGTEADLTGAHGDVFMRLPKFYYQATSSETDVWRVTFKAGNEIPTEGEWKLWDGNDLIGVYKASIDSNARLRSVSGVQTASNLSHDEMKEKAKNRNLAFSLVKWKHHCMLAHLFMAKYGSTNSQNIIGAGIAAYEYTTGLNDGLGMTDTITLTKPDESPINFWGLEGWWGGLFEWIDNVVVNGPEWTVTEENDQFTYTPCMTSSGYISKLGIGSDLHAFPVAGGATETTGYCDSVQESDLSSTDMPVARSGIANNGQAGIFNCGARKYKSNVSSRLAYSGDIIEVADVSEFKAIDNWK